MFATIQLGSNLKFSFACLDFTWGIVTKDTPASLFFSSTVLLLACFHHHSLSLQLVSTETPSLNAVDTSSVNLLLFSPVSDVGAVSATAAAAAPTNTVPGVGDLLLAGFEGESSSFPVLLFFALPEVFVFDLGGFVDDDFDGLDDDWLLSSSLSILFSGDEAAVVDFVLLFCFGAGDFDLTAGDLLLVLSDLGDGDLLLDLPADLNAGGNSAFTEKADGR